jgi:hypothetical protein
MYLTYIYICLSMLVGLLSALIKFNAFLNILTHVYKFVK